MSTQPVVQDPSQVVPMYDPQGTLRDVPFTQAHDALAAGGKPALRFQAPDNSIRYVPADQTQDAVKAGGKLLPLEQQSPGIPKFYGFTPGNIASNVYQGAKGIISGSYDVAKDLVNNPNWVQGPDSTMNKFIGKPSQDQIDKASKALQSGNRTEAAGHILASALPLIGPWAAGLGQQAGTGDVGGAVGQAAGTVAGGELLARAPGLVKAGVSQAGPLAAKAIEPVSAAITADPHELMTRAIKPTASNTRWGDDIKTAMPELKAAEQTSGKPVTGVDDLLDTVAQAKKNVWGQYQAKLTAAQAARGGTPPTIDGNAIADQMMASIDKRQATLDPGLVDRVKAQADTYRRPIPLAEAEDFLQSANNDLNTYYSKSKVSQRVAAGDPSIAPTLAEANTLRQSLYDKLDELTPEGDKGAAELKQTYGALSNVEKEAYRRQNVAARQQPASLAQQLNVARGYGQTALGVGALASGHYGVGGALIGEGLMETGVGNWLKGRQTTDSMIQRAFENYGKPPSMLNTLVSGTKGEAGPPGSVSELDDKLAKVNNSIRTGDDTALYQQAREDLGANASFSDVVKRAQDLKTEALAMRRTPADTMQDVREAAAKDPNLAGLEAASKGRAAEMAKKYPVGQISNVQDPFARAPEPNAPTFYSKAEQAAQKLPGSATGEQMLNTLVNQGVKPSELAYSRADEWLKGQGKVTRAQVQDYLKQNGVRLGEKTLGDINNPNIPSSVDIPGVKYQSYTEPGPKANYAEKLITLPDKASSVPNDVTIEARNVLDKVNSKRGTAMTLENWGSGYDPVRIAHNAMENGDITQKEFNAINSYSRALSKKWGSDNFQSSHWDEPNVLAHARYDDRTLADGKKALFVEETQSDWHQQGKKKGYASPGEEPILKGRLDDEGEVPDAPFKNDWHELVMKRMLREAAERGADKLAWTTGDQQAERYDLGKQVSHVEYTPSVQRLEAYDHDGNKVVDQPNTPPERLADYIGKGPADKLLNAPKVGKGDDAYHHIEGGDLKVGGEWAKALYDRAIPNFMNKYLKRYGVRVGSSELPAQPAKTPETTSKEGAYYSLPIEGRKVHSVDITPQMKRDLLKVGQPIASERSYDSQAERAA